MRLQLALLGLLASLAMALGHGLVRAQENTTVDVELFLAVDVSRSMSPRELEIQRRGYAEALASKQVVQAITGGLYGQIALTYVEWAGEWSQRVVVGWTLIASQADAEAFAAQLTAHFDSSMRRTSISSALDYAADAFDGNGFRGIRRVIDVSGDGPNNNGRPVLWARDDALAKGLTINGLPLMTREGMGSQWHLEDLDQYYINCVIGGPGSFVLPVKQWEHFATAVRRKMVLELAGLLPAPTPASLLLKAQLPQEPQGYDCLIGEKIWDSFVNDPL
jgi:hypothetical protein